MAEPAAGPEPELRISREEYRRWAEAQPKGRFERVDGAVVATAPERSNHARRKALVWLALRQAVVSGGLSQRDGDRGGDSDFEPDAVPRCGDPLDGDYGNPEGP